MMKIRAGAGFWKIAAGALALAGSIACSGNQSVFNPKGVQAGRVASLGWFLFGIAAVVYVIMMVLVAFVFRRGRGNKDETPEDSARLEPERNRKMERSVKTGVAITAVILIVFLVLSVGTGNAYQHISAAEPLRIDVTGHQWWWEIEYFDPISQNTIKTANEIHVPVGRPVYLKMTSSDVIHSFWAPNLSGKKDLIPGHETKTWFRADTAGIYRGQCAEFCGHQHAKMAFFIVAEPKADFDKWVLAQRQPAQKPADSIQAKGEEIFLNGTCSMCHAVTGTSAGSNVGPDLTHIASRRTIAAGALPNNRGNMAGWIMDPQSIKPGAKMPPNQLDGRSLQALLAYLENLK
jgi:cytochrome c oxidase subunit II